MKSVDIIEYILRTSRGSSNIEAVFALIKEMDKDFDMPQMKEALKAGKERFVVGSDGSITLRPERLEDRVGYFRQKLWALRDALHLMPFRPSQGLELALIYMLATLEHDTLLEVDLKGEGLRTALDKLDKEFPEWERELSMSFAAGGFMVNAPVKMALMQMATVQLSPEEYVQEMRDLIARDVRSGQFCVPWSVATLMARLLGDVEEVFDPSADASVLPAVLSVNKPRSVQVDAVFLNRSALLFNTLQARILGTELNAAVNEPSAPGDPNKKYLHCISAPPFGARIKEAGSLRAIQSHEITTNQIIKRLAPGGRAVILVPESMLFSTNGKVLRKQLIDLGMLNAVISLPVGTFQPYAGVKTSILVLEKVGAVKERVRFLDASLHVTERIKAQVMLDVDGILRAYSSNSPLTGVLDVRTTDILADELVSWTMSRFVSQLSLDGIEANGRGVAVVQLGSLLFDDILSMGDVEGLPLFQVAQLSSDILDMTLTAKAGQDPTGQARRGARRLDVPALLLARVGGRLKPTVFDPSDGPIAVGNNVFMFRVDTEKADPEYLASELRTATVQDQLDAYHQGSTIPSIAKNDLAWIRLRLPLLADQQRILRERKEAVLIAQKEEIARQEDKHGLSTSEWQILGAVEHSFRPVVALLEQPMAEIQRAMDNIGAGPKATITSALHTMNVGLDRMRGLFQLINAVIRSDKESLRPVPVDLRRLCRTEVRGLAEQVKDLMVFFECEAGLETQEGVIARIDQQQFALVIQNLFINMAKHGLRHDQEQVVVLVRVSTRSEPQRTWLVLTIENNGKPFPQGFTHEEFITFGKRLDPTKGSGIGGYLIDRIIANHGGRFISGNLPFSEEPYRSGSGRDQRIDDNHWSPLDWEAISTHMTVHFTIELPISHSND